ncbi:MAG: prolipoprotein diacylglyceryl transferase family protein [Chloroflexota bacterium]
MLPFIQLGPFTLQAPGLALLMGVWLGLSLSEKEAIKLKLDPDQIYNLIFYGLVAGVVGARLGYALQYPRAYLDSPWSLVALTPNTLAPEIGLLFAIIAALIYGKRQKMLLRPTLDALAPGLAAFMVSFGVAHFMSGDAFGAPTKLPWAIYLWDDYRHPSQVYETLAAMIILLVVWRRPLGQRGGGVNFLWVVALSAATRIFLEAFRGDSVIWVGGFRAAQVSGVVVLAASLWLMRRWSHSASTVEEKLIIQTKGDS